MSVIRKIFSKKLFFNLQKQVRGFSMINNTSSETNIVCSDSSDIVLPAPNESLAEVLLLAMEPFHKYVAVECGITGKKYTYDQLRIKSINLGKALRKKFKLGKGDVAAIHLPNCPEYFVTVLGILFSGAVLTTLNPLYSAEEISRQLLDSGAKIIITQIPYCQRVKQAINLTKKDVPIIAIKEKEGDHLQDGVASFEELLNIRTSDLCDIVSGKSSDLAFLPYSSGTTGLPKGVLLTHHNLLSNGLQATHADFNMHTKAEGELQDIVPMIIPLYHIYGFMLAFMGNLTQGCKIVTLPKFTPENFVSLLMNYNITHLYGAPPLMLFIISNDAVKPEYFKKLKMSNNGAAPLAYSDEIRFKEKIQNAATFVRQGYGLTETSPVITCTPIGTKLKEEIGGSVGKVIPNTLVKIVASDDPTGTPLGPNQQGELLVKGPQVTQGYYNRPEETKNSFLDGWFKTGDMAYYNDEGFFFITDRLKELIKVKGFQVPPAELEAVIRTFPSVDDAAVIGIPDPIQGELPRAYVIPKKDKQFVSEELQAFVASKVAKYKQLSGGVRIVESIPKNPAGKILRRKLKDDFETQGI